ncbi:hypothetical protein [Anaeromicropila populeti]|uniref:Uncharacterized protein n=1 Tax=Anaeromicropila populeti TaxID=37658 RepID=A0A1I6K7Y5_9FIRM|nr:hypothetical protein [Anaeromicropila populeti]SFR87274.1 hypothetical protein SAMN05661086_02261 [Anaeromicropila populeti]
MGDELDYYLNTTKSEYITESGIQNAMDYDNSVANTNRRLAAARRMKQYCINQEPILICEEGNLYNIYLIHQNEQKCKFHSNTVDIGKFQFPYEALNEGRKIQQNAVLCPDCMREHISEKEFNNFWKNQNSAERPFKHYIMCRYGDVQGQFHLHQKNCSHYERNEEIDFGYQISFSEFLNEIRERYPKVTMKDVFSCPHCMEHVYKELGFEDHWSSKIHYVREKVSGGVQYHTYNCQACSKEAVDLGWDNIEEDIEEHVNIKGSGLAGIHLHSCIPKSNQESLNSRIFISLMKKNK